MESILKYLLVYKITETQFCIINMNKIQNFIFLKNYGIESPN